MVVLVTGGAGYVGSFVTRAIVQAGYEVVVVDNLVEGHAEALPSQAVLVRADICDAAALVGVFKERDVQVVVHLAALAAIEPSVRDPMPYFDVNVGGSLNLVRAMIEHGVSRLVFSSTAAVYGTPAEVPIPESHELAPINAYGESKLMVERLLKWLYGAYGLRSISFRYFNVAGALPDLGESRSEESHLLPLLLDVAADEGETVRIFGTDYPTSDGTAVRDYVHVRDVARAHVLALERLLDQDMCESINLGSGEARSVLEMVEAVRRVTGRPMPISREQRRAGDPPVLAATIAKAAELLDWTPVHSKLDEIVSSAWEWKTRHPTGHGAVASDRVSS